MTDIFLKIINREIPAYIVYEDSDFLAFLDINPVVPGHTLLIPKVCIDYFYDLDNQMLSNMIICSKKISEGIQKTFHCKKVGTAVIGLDVKHAHMHLIPINAVEDFNFSKHTQLSQHEMTKICNNIKSNINT